MSSSSMTDAYESLLLESSLLNILSGAQTIDGGEVERGETIVFGVYNQMGLVVPKEDVTIMEFIQDQVKDA